MRTSSTSSTPTESTPESKLSFRELKKELKDFEKLTKQNLDINSWANELKAWIKYQHIKDPETIFTACILTASGEPREIIQELEDGNDLTEDEDSDFDSDSEGEDDEESESTSTYPSLDEIINHLKTFYGLKEDQTNLLRELRSMKIKKNEKVKDFNVRYRSLYHKLDKKRRRKISVLDYADSLTNNPDAWRKVMLKDHISITKAFAIAEKVDRLSIKNSTEYYDKTRYNLLNSKSNFNKNISNDFNKPKTHKNVSIENLTNKMKEMKISTCWFCSNEGHTKRNCPKLNSILENNRKKFYENHLNH